MDINGIIELLIFSSILLLGFFIRFYPRVKHKFAFGSDTYFHLYYADLYRKNRFAVPEKSEKVIIKHKISYPYIYHFLLAIFPEKARLKVERYLSPSFDVATLLAFITGISFLYGYNIDQITILLIVALLFAFSPALLKFEGIPRAFQGSPRVFGQFLYMVHLIGFIVFVDSGSYLALAISIIFGGMVWLSAKFAIQVMVFFAIIFIPFFNSYVFPFFGSLIFAFIFSKGKLFLLIKGHIYHSQYLLRKLDISPKRNGFREFKNHIYEMLKALVKFDIKKINKIFFSEDFPPFTFLVFFPFFMVLADYHLIHRFTFLYVWVSAGFIFYLLTSTRKLSFLGENTRYLEFSILPAMYLSVIFILENNFILLLIAYLVFSIYASAYYINNFIHKFITSTELHLNRKQLFASLNKKEQGNLFAMCSTGHPALLLSKFPVLSLLTTHLDRNLFGEEEFDLLGSNFPYPSGRFVDILKKYDIQYVTLTDSEEQIYLQRYIDKEDLFRNNLRLIDQFGSLKLYRVIRKSIT